MLSVEEARARVLAAVSAVGTEDVLVGDALGRVLAGQLVAPHALPRFDNSAMDGYAVRADDFGGP
ncbi:MAG: molybdopterin molybdenumtransferase MoeA, partial [Actinobacteria bacterium]|nr:molybdopterin molybdenumtransferase MoeA [Actinomycetota bacterium]